MPREAFLIRDSEELEIGPSLRVEWPTAKPATCIPVRSDASFALDGQRRRGSSQECHSVVAKELRQFLLLASTRRRDSVEHRLTLALTVSERRQRWVAERCERAA